MSRTRTGEMHFTLTGEAFTTIARGLMLDGRHDKAWRIIAHNIAGCDDGEASSIAQRVLDGKSRFVGDESGMTTEDDPDAGEYRDRVQRLYAGRVNLEGKWHCPSTVVTSNGPDDAYYAGKTHGYPSHVIDTARFSRWAKRRAEFYGADGVRAIDCFRERRGYVLFEECGAPPTWWRENATPNDALADFLCAGNTLREDGYCARRGEFPQSPMEALREAAGEERIAYRHRDDADDHAQRETEFAAEVARVREEVQRRAGGETIDLLDYDGNVVATVPRAPFLNYALWRTPMASMAPPWEAVSRPGMKTGAADDPLHSDWFFGAGLTFEHKYDYDGAVHKAAINTMMEVQREYGRFQCAVLVSGEPVIGTVGEGIAVLPNLSMDHYETARVARAIITEAGGALAHMAVVMREQGVPIVLVANARKLYPKGTLVNINPQVGRVEVLHGEALCADDGEES